MAAASSAAAPASSWSDLLPLLGNGAYLALASGFLMTDVFALRVLLSCGYSSLVVYHACQAKPLWIPLRWSCVFVVVNVVAASSLAADRWPGALSAEEEELHAQNFAQLTRGQMKQLLALGERVHLARGEELTREGDVSEHLYFLVSGRAKLFLHGRFAANIETGGFVNDVAFQQGKDVGAYGTVVVSSAEPCTAVVWRQAELIEFLRARPEMHRNLNHVLNATLVKGLLAQREAAHMQRDPPPGAREAAVAKAAAVASSVPRSVRLQMTASEMHLMEDTANAVAVVANAVQGAAARVAS